VGASLVTAAVVELLFEITPGQREALEGVTMLVATAVLFYVSYWLLSKVEVAKWSAFVKGRMEEALSTGSGFALASVAFLAVLSRGLRDHPVLQGPADVAGSGGGGSAAGPVLAGIALGVVALVIVYVAISRFGMKVPLKPFFAVTSAMLYYMAFVFAGKGSPICRSPGSWGRRWSNGATHPGARHLPHRAVSIASAPADRPAGRGGRVAPAQSVNGAEPDRRRPSFP